MKFSLDVLSTSEADKLAAKRNTVKERNREENNDRKGKGNVREMEREEQTLAKNTTCIPTRKLRLILQSPKH